MNAAALVLATLHLLAAAPAAAAPPAGSGALNEALAIARLVDADRLTEAGARLKRATLPDDVRLQLAGVIALQQHRYADAVRDLAAASVLRPDDANLRLYLASAQLGAGDAVSAAATLAGTDELGETVVAQPLLVARVRSHTGDTDGAYEVLASAAKRFPAEVAPRLELVVLCSTHELRAAARAWARSLVEPGRAALDRATVLELFAALHRDPLARPLLEQLAAARPGDAELIARLAHAYAAADGFLAAARLFERATRLGGDHAFEAADQYRLAGHARAALAMNARVRDPQRRLAQRVGILFGAGELARVVALERELARHGVTDGETRVRLAHAHWALGRHARATELARKLLGTTQDGRARALLAAMGRAAQTEQPEEPGAE